MATLYLEGSSCWSIRSNRIMTLSWCDHMYDLYICEFPNVIIIRSCIYLLKWLNSGLNVQRFDREDGHGIIIACHVYASWYTQLSLAIFDFLNETSINKPLYSMYHFRCEVELGWSIASGSPCTSTGIWKALCWLLIYSFQRSHNIQRTCVLLTDTNIKSPIKDLYRHVLLFAKIHRHRA